MFQPLDNTTSFWNEKPVTKLSDMGGGKVKNRFNFLKKITRQPSLKKRDWMVESWTIKFTFSITSSTQAGQLRDRYAAVCMLYVCIAPPFIWSICHAGQILRIQFRDCFWSFSPVGRRLSEQIASSTRDIWSSDHYSAVTTAAKAERSPGDYCIRVVHFPGSDCEEYENVETEFILHFNIISPRVNQQWNFKGEKLL